jgi:hypothetical protein
MTMDNDNQKKSIFDEIDVFLSTQLVKHKNYIEQKILLDKIEKLLKQNNNYQLYYFVLLLSHVILMLSFYCLIFNNII